MLEIHRRILLVSSSPEEPEFRTVIWWFWCNNTSTNPVNHASLNREITKRRIWWVQIRFLCTLCSISFWWWIWCWAFQTDSVIWKNTAHRRSYSYFLVAGIVYRLWTWVDHRRQVEKLKTSCFEPSELLWFMMKLHVSVAFDWFSTNHTV